VVMVRFRGAKMPFAKCVSFHTHRAENSGNSGVHISLQNFGLSIWNFLHVTLTDPRIFRWVLDLWKICGREVFL
jgi:hypothetical protein